MIKYQLEKIAMNNQTQIMWTPTLQLGIHVLKGRYIKLVSVWWHLWLKIVKNNSWTKSYLCKCVLTECMLKQPLLYFFSFSLRNALIKYLVYLWNNIIKSSNKNVNVMDPCPEVIPAISYHCYEMTFSSSSNISMKWLSLWVATFPTFHALFFLLWLIFAVS